MSMSSFPNAIKQLHICLGCQTFSNFIFLQAYAKARLQGIHEVGEVLLSISSELMSFNFRETFVNAFDVSNIAENLHMMLFVASIYTYTTHVPASKTACRFLTRLLSF